MKPKKNKNNGVEILIAEDSPTQAEKLQYLLEEHGYAVVTARDGKQALAAARRRKPALIVSDVMMPEMDGFALCGEIKRDDKLKGVPVILLTTLSDPRDVIRGLESGADNFIRKPYDEHYLLSRLDYLLMNLDLRKDQKMQMGVEIYLSGQKHVITAERQQILDLLISVYEEAVHISEELKVRQSEMAKEIAERKQAEEALLKAKAATEAANRGLELVNKELEAFSYSVSHDLRAPLRSIDGFSQAVLEDYADRLDDQAKDYLNRVRAATQRMGHLIDDMLALARVTRAEMRRETVDLSALADGVLAELQKSEPGRKVDGRIESGLVAEGDAQLLRVVLVNLLGNAWKYTARQPQPRIEFGAMRNADGAPTYFVHDNGVGFDMAYADKLFGAFQRLHTSIDFPGTGVGLATVQRIVHRHGGQVRGEGVPDQGATFSFTLPA